MTGQQLGETLLEYQSRVWAVSQNEITDVKS